MNPNRQIVCACNLLMFVASFVLLSLFTLHLKNSVGTSDHVHTSFIQNGDNSVLGSFQQLTEKEETENESDVDACTAFFILPFLLTGQSLVGTIASIPDFNSPIEILSKPIYLVVSNFRI